MSPANTSDRRAWVRNTLSPSDWLVPLPPGAVDELESVVQGLRREPRPSSPCRSAAWSWRPWRGSSMMG